MEVEPVQQGQGQAHRPRAPSYCSALAHYAPHVYRYVQPMFYFFIVLRVCLYQSKALVIPVCISNIHFQSSTIELTVFLIGVILFSICLISLVSMIHVFKVLGLLSLHQVKKLTTEPQQIPPGVEIVTLCLVPYSFLFSFWLFVFVREKWSSTFAAPVQVLHCIPTAVILFNTIAQVLMIICVMTMLARSSPEGNRHSQLTLDDKDDLLLHMHMNISINALFIIYSVSVLFMVCTGGDTLKATWETIVAVIPELIFRLLSIASAHSLENTLLNDSDSTPEQQLSLNDFDTSTLIPFPIAEMGTALPDIPVVSSSESENEQNEMKEAALLCMTNAVQSAEPAADFLPIDYQQAKPVYPSLTWVPTSITTDGKSQVAVQ